MDQKFYTIVDGGIIADGVRIFLHRIAIRRVKNKDGKIHPGGVQTDREESGRGRLRLETEGVE